MRSLFRRLVNWIWKKLFKKKVKSSRDETWINNIEGAKRSLGTYQWLLADALKRQAELSAYGRENTEEFEKVEMRIGTVTRQVRYFTGIVTEHGENSPDKHKRSEAEKISGRLGMFRKKIETNVKTIYGRAANDSEYLPDCRDQSFIKQTVKRGK